MLSFLKIQIKCCQNFEFYVIPFFIPCFQPNTGTEPTRSALLLLPNTGMERTRSSGMEPFHSMTLGSPTKHTLRASIAGHPNPPQMPERAARALTDHEILTQSGVSRALNARADRHPSYPAQIWGRYWGVRVLPLCRTDDGVPCRIARKPGGPMDASSFAAV